MRRAERCSATCMKRSRENAGWVSHNSRGLAVTQTKHKMWCLALVAKPLDASLDRRSDVLDFHGPAPLGGSRHHGAVIGAETSRIAILTEFLAAELTDVVLTAGGHFGRFGVADVGIVRLNNAFAVFAMISKQDLEGVKHMVVTQILRRARPIVHDAVIAFSIGHQA